MDATVSVSKGVFLFSNGFKKSKNHSKKKTGHTLFEKIFKKELWYTTYKANWNFIENQIQDLHQRTYSLLLDDIVKYIKTFYSNNESFMQEGIIPSATLLTGVNQPDHVSQFTALVDNIRNEVTSHVAIVNSQDASSVKHLVENVVWQLIKGSTHSMDVSEDDVNTDHSKSKLKKNLCTMTVLSNWFKSKYMTHSPKKNKFVSTRPLVIIVPDFESFKCAVLQDFVMIISSYVSTLPIILVFGVATSVSVLHKSFPYHVSSKLLVKVFHSHSSPVYVNQVLEEIFLTHTSPFHLSGKTFELLTDVFLFYDFSVTGLIQSIKYCMMDHYYGDNTKSLCCDRSSIEEVVNNLSVEDLENIRQLMSFRPYLESQDCKTKINLFEDDIFFRNILIKKIDELHDYFHTFYMCVRLLSAIVKEMPKIVLGKTVREIYTKCAAEYMPEMPAFKEIMQLLNFQSQEKLVDTVNSTLKIVQSYLQTSPTKLASPTKHYANNLIPNNDLGLNFTKTVHVHLMMFLRQIENASTEATMSTNTSVDEDDVEKTLGSRYKLKEKLLAAAKVDRLQSEFEMVRSRFISYLEETFSRGLHPPHTRAFYEIVLFSGVGRVRKQLVGSPRGALHCALTNPAHYLQCSCCRLSSSEDMAESLPDLCVAYKLHRECGRHVNLFDWLQAFCAVLQPPADGPHPALQLRFTRAVSELQFLGFIKSSKRKTDHVMRLTW